MYSKNQAAELKKEFWTVLGQYMAPVKSAEGDRISWLNYKTGEKYIFIRLNADNKSASIAVELHHPDIAVQQLYFEQFRELKKIFYSVLQEEWKWQLPIPDGNNKIISKIYKELYPVNIFNKEDWPKLVSFFKPRLIALDEFWSAAKYTFELLR